jgi:hypothetical protein
MQRMLSVLLRSVVLLGGNSLIFARGARQSRSLARSQLNASDNRLGIYAVTLNAGNENYAKHPEHFKLMFQSLTRGHDSADLVVMGFQELKDDGNKLGQELRKALWGGNQAAEMEVKHQQFSSGRICHLNNHYDTIQYVFLNPSSKWSLTLVDYSSKKCKKGSKESTGCSMNYNGKSECGKVVNLQKIKVAEKGTKGKTITHLCLMNTHMSFKGKSSDRATNIAKSMAEAKRAKCDDVIFVGDFNSRLSCRAVGDASKTPNNPSLKDVIKHFCDEKNLQNANECSLSRNQNENWDEMYQMLNNKDLSCFEKEKSGFLCTSKTCKLKKLSNPVMKHGLSEVAIPSFPPSYKHVNKKAMSDIQKKHGDDWVHCFGGEDVCIGNEDKKPKHNPAWTDRVLIKPGKKTKEWQNKLYERRPAPEIKTDHAIVAARVDLVYRR